MEALVRALSRFIARDIFYAPGSLSVIFSFMVAMDVDPPSNLPTPHILFAVGIGYVLGYAIHDGFALTPFVNASLVVHPNWFLIALYERLARMKWQAPENFDAFGTYLRMYSDLSPEQTAPIERMISLNHIGTTMGANGIVSFVLFGLVWYWGDSSAIKGVLCISSFVLSVLLLCLAYLQAMETHRALGQLRERFRKEDGKDAAEQASEADT